MSTDMQSTLARIQALADGFTGTIGVYAKHLGTGETIEFNPDEYFPTASTMKTVLLYELYRQVDAGKIDPTQRIVFEDRHRVPGSGVLQHLDAEINPTVKDLAMLMIIVSDNAATDLVYDLVGREAVAKTLRELGMNNTHLPLDTWEILAGLFDLDPADPELTYESFRAKFRERQSSFDCAALKETPDNDISTPRDMVRLHEAIEHAEGISAAARELILDILKRQNFTSIIPEQLPFGVTCAHKTGSLRGVKNDVGLVYAGDTTYAVALMSKGNPSKIAGQRTLSEVSKIIYEHFVGPIAPETVS